MRFQRGTVTQWHRWRTHIPEQHLRLLALAAVVLIIALAFALKDQMRLAAPETIGYPAVFLISLFGSATLILPVPAILAVCWGGVVLNPLVVGLVAGIAQALGETTGYLAGFSGSGLASKTRMYQRIQPRMQRQGWIVVLIFSAIPNPLFDIVGLAAGATRMPLWQFLSAAGVGKTVRSIAVAYGCAFGYDLFRVLG